MDSKMSEDSFVAPTVEAVRISVKASRKRVAVKSRVEPASSIPISDLSNNRQDVVESTPAKPKKRATLSTKGESVQKKSTSLSETQTDPAPSVSSTLAMVVRKLKVTQFSAKVPKVTQGRMRAVAYIGVAYILTGVCTGSYALANMHKADFQAGAVLQAASALLGVSSSDSLLTNNAITTTSGSPGTSGISGSGTSGDSTSGTSASSDIASVTTTAATSTSDTDDALRASTTTTNTAYTLPATTPVPATTISSTIAAATLTPMMSFHFSQSSPFSGKVGLGMTVSGADHIELSAVPQNALTPLYLGNANFMSGSLSEWSYIWDTKDVPNGYYSLVARVFNHYGSYETRKDVAIRNIATTSSTAQTSSITSTANGLESAITSIVNTRESGSTIVASTSIVSSVHQALAVTIPAVEPSQLTAVTFAPETHVAVQPSAITETTPDSAKPDDTKKTSKEFQMEAVVNAFTLRLQASLERYGVAVRAGDENAMKLVKDDIFVDRNQTLTTLKERGLLSGQSPDAISAQLDVFITQGLTNIEAREKVIKERVGISVTIDTDKDGIVDYDEIHLYKTNPLSADTDNDGFTDGAEIMSGFDPLSPNKQAVKTFEDPVKRGPLRKDILSVVKVETEHASTTGRVEARFSGKGLPNSFVTLYIFSTPVVVTVRTGDDGSWSYVFDKELEDGSHTVYAGITDNAGRIVAKSEPFSFIKKAEAYSGVVAGEPEAVVVPQSSELMSQNTFLLISALSVILLGLALVALGAYFMRPQEYELIPSNT